MKINFQCSIDKRRIFSYFLLLLLHITTTVMKITVIKKPQVRDASKAYISVSSSSSIIAARPTVVLVVVVIAGVVGMPKFCSVRGSEKS